MSEIIVTIAHMRAATLGQGRVNCATGVRGWFELHGLDYRRCLREGVPASELARADDAWVAKAIAMARAEVSDV